MEEQKSMLGNLFLFMIIIFLLLTFSKQVSVYAEGFFKTQQGLINMVSSQPLLIIIFLSFIFSFIASLFYKFGIDKETLKQIKDGKEESKRLQKQIKENRGNPQKSAVLQKELMEKSMQSMSASFKLMFSKRFIFLVTVPSIILLFFIVGPLYMAADVGYMIPKEGFKFLWFGRVGGWLFCIILFSMVFTPIIKKMLKSEF